MNAHLLRCLASAIIFATPVAAQAGNPDGKIQVKLLGTAVLPDGAITRINTDLIGLPAGSNTAVNDNFVPTIAIEYFFTPNISAETICCVTQHDVDGTGPLAGLRLVDDLLILPATLTLKYHLTGLGAIKPYVGAGPAWFLMLDYKAGPGAIAAGAAREGQSQVRRGAAGWRGYRGQRPGAGFHARRQALLHTPGRQFLYCCRR